MDYGLLGKALCTFFVKTPSLVFICHEAAGHHDEPGKPGSRIIFSHIFHLSLRTTVGGGAPAEIPAELYNPHSLDDVHVHRTTQRKRGKRGGIRGRQKRLSLDNCCRLPPLPTVLLSNVQSSRNKVDELEAWAKFKPEVRETCLLAFTETWLSEVDQDGDKWVWQPTSSGPVPRDHRYSVRGTVTPLRSGKSYVLLILNCCVSHFALTLCLVNFNNFFSQLFTFIHVPTEPQRHS